MTRVGHAATSLTLTVAVIGAILFLPEFAAAVEIRVTGPPSFSQAADPTFVLDFVFQTGERVPVDRFEAILEGPTPGTVAFTPEGVLIGTPPAFVVSLTAASVGLAGYGYGYSNGAFQGTGEGYGYGAEGYGYAGAGVSGPYVFTPASGDGYGEISGTGTLRYTLVLDGAQLATGSYRMTARIALPAGASPTADDFQSPAFLFTVTPAGGGGGGGGPSVGPAGEILLTTFATGLPEGAAAAFEAFVPSAGPGDVVVVSPEHPWLSQITLLVDGPVSGGTVSVVLWPAQSPVPGAPPIPDGVVPAFFVEVSFSGPDSASTAEFGISLAPDQVVALGRGVLLHWVGDGWVVADRLELVGGGDGTSFTGSPESSCCSVFAVAFDPIAPALGIQASLLSAGRQLEVVAQVEENLAMDRVEFWLADQRVALRTQEPWQALLDVSGLGAGAHSVRVVAVDAAGGQSSASAPFVVEAASEQPPDGPARPPIVRDLPSWSLALVAFVVVGAVVVTIWFAAFRLRGRSG